MTNCLYVLWLRSGGRTGPATDDQIRRTASAFQNALDPASTAAAYRLVEAGATTRDLGKKSHHLEPPFHSRLDDPTAPDMIVLAPLPGLDEARTLRRRTIDADGPAPFTVVADGLYSTLFVWTAPDRTHTDEFADVVHFGTYDTRSPGDEWALAHYYAEVRMPAFLQQPGAVRARRLTTACAAPGRTGVLYEFDSIAARLENFEPLEAQKAAAEAQSLTLHGPLSPSIGVRVS